MFNHNFLVYSGQIFIQILGEIIYFPFWWYGAGCLRTARHLWAFLGNQEKSLGFTVWLKNIFVPMYGQRDIAGRFISFFMRLIQIIFRGAVLIIWLVVVFFIFIFWLALPPALLLALAAQF